MSRIRIAILVLPALIGAGVSATSAAEPVMVQCGREYQAAQTAGTLNGMDWARYRVDCAARLKAGTASAAASGAAQPVTVPAPAAVPAPVAVAGSATLAGPSGGAAAMHGRQKQCGAEWRAQKATLTAQTPGLTWPRYWSQCNSRLKASGR